MIRLYTDNDYNYKTSSDNANLVLDGVYFYGNSEHILGHDIICIPHDTIIEEGIHDFEVRDSTHDHQILTGKLYIWGGIWRQRGLAIESGDSVGNKYAIKCYNDKVNSL